MHEIVGQNASVFNLMPAQCPSVPHNFSASWHRIEHSLMPAIVVAFLICL